MRIDTGRAREELVAAAESSDDAVVAWVAANVDLILAELDDIYAKGRCSGCGEHVMALCGWCGNDD